MIRSVSIAGRPIGPGHPTYVVAEAGVNHDGDPARARALVAAAHQAGADAVKFQTFTAAGLARREATKPGHVAQTAGAGESMFAILKRLELTPEGHHAALDEATRRGITCFSTPSTPEDVDFLVGLGVPALKLGSDNLVNLPMLRHAARTDLPLIVSTGMGTLGEVERALGAIAAAGNDQVILLHCVSVYPPDDADMNLRAMETLRTAFGIPVGFSDHSLGVDLDLAAVALGACMVEKHFTLDKSLPGPDHRCSADPAELRVLVAGARRIERALGDGRKAPSPAERANARAFRKSIVARVAIPAGTRLEPSHLTTKRPADGLPPDLWDLVIGRTTSHPLAPDEPLRLGDLR